MNKSIPMRQCVGCGEMQPKRDMIRVIKTAEGAICLDATGKKNGRGAYLCNKAQCLEKAISRKGLERSLRMSLPAAIYEQLKEEFQNGSE